MALIHDDRPHKYRLPRIDALGADHRDLIIEGVASVAEQHQPKSPNRWITPEIFDREKLTIVPCALFTHVRDAGEGVVDRYWPRNPAAEVLCDLVSHDWLTIEQISLVKQLGFNVEVKS